jgi:hypothetical protein
MCLREFLDSVVNPFTRQTLLTVNRKHFFMNILCIESFCPQKHTTERYCSVVHSLSTVAVLTTETSLWTWHACLLPRLSWSWTVLPPSDAHRKPITSVNSCFTFVCDLFTDISYLQNELLEKHVVVSPTGPGTKNNCSHEGQQKFIWAKWP